MITFNYDLNVDFIRFTKMIFHCRQSQIFFIQINDFAIELLYIKRCWKSLRVQSNERIFRLYIYLNVRILNIYLYLNE